MQGTIESSCRDWRTDHQVPVRHWHSIYRVFQQSGFCYTEQLQTHDVIFVQVFCIWCGRTRNVRQVERPIQSSNCSCTVWCILRVFQISKEPAGGRHIIVRCRRKTEQMCPGPPTTLAALSTRRLWRETPGARWRWEHIYYVQRFSAAWKIGQQDQETALSGNHQGSWCSSH